MTIFALQLKGKSSKKEKNAFAYYLNWKNSFIASVF